MIKKIGILSPLLFLIILLSLIIFDFFQSDKTINKKIDEPDVPVQKEIVNQRDYVIANNFIEENSKYVNKNYYDNLKFTVFKKDVSFKDLDSKTKTIIFISKCITIKKEIVKLNKSSDFASGQPQKLKEFEKQIQNIIDKEKKMLYEEYGKKLHPLDKMLLDKIDE